MTKCHVTQEWLKTFIRAWHESDNVGEVARELKIEKRKAHYLSCRLRKMGVSMKKMRRGPAIDYPALSQYSASLG